MKGKEKVMKRKKGQKEEQSKWKMKGNGNDRKKENLYRKGKEMIGKGKVL